jgi:hypothetical protein
MKESVDGLRSSIISFPPQQGLGNPCHFPVLLPYPPDMKGYGSSSRGVRGPAHADLLSRAHARKGRGPGEGGRSSSPLSCRTEDPELDRSMVRGSSSHLRCCPSPAQATPAPPWPPGQGRGAEGEEELREPPSCPAAGASRGGAEVVGPASSTTRVDLVSSTTHRRGEADLAPGTCGRRDEGPPHPCSCSVRGPIRLSPAHRAEETEGREATPAPSSDGSATSGSRGSTAAPPRRPPYHHHHRVALLTTIAAPPLLPARDGWPSLELLGPAPRRRTALRC